MAIRDRFKKAWNAFQANEKIRDDYGISYGTSYGPSYGSSPSRPRFHYSGERTIISSIYTSIARDAAGVDIRHIKTDDLGRYSEDIKSPLNMTLQLEPNLDQGPRAFRQDIVNTLFDKGVAAIVPVETSENPNSNAKFDIYNLRVGDVVSWYPKHVKVNVYNENKGEREEITLAKRYVAIVENPLYAVMNEPNSTLQRLIRKLNMLDAVDEVSSSGKLDLIIQLPYVIKSEARRQQAEQRRSDIEFQLKGSQYGIAYTDGTEKITQLNRPAENNLMKQIEYLVNMLYDQLGITNEVLNGTADEKTMLNYYTRTLEPILDAIIQAMQRSFLGIVGTKQHEQIKYFRDPFKLVPISEVAEIADKLTRNEIASSNEIRSWIGLPPAKDPKADELVNSNMPQPGAPISTGVQAPTEDSSQIDALIEEMDSIVNGVLDEVEKDIDLSLGGADG